MKKNPLMRWIDFWLTVLVSRVRISFKKIPKDTGDSIRISTNAYLTKQYISSSILITDLRNEAPISLFSLLVKEVRKAGNKCLVDFTIKNMAYKPNILSTVLKSKHEYWKGVLERGTSADYYMEEAARHIYTYECVNNRQTLYKSVMCITVRGKSDVEIKSCKDIIMAKLSMHGVKYNDLTIGMLGYLRVGSIISNDKKSFSQLPYLITSNRMFSELMPNLSSYAEKEGTYVALNILNNQPVIVDLSKVTKARNILIIGPSGEGKTVLGLNLASSMIEQGSIGVFTDIKGNEYTNIVRALGGIIVNLTPGGKSYLNTWRMIYDENLTLQENISQYEKNIEISKYTLLTLSLLDEKDESRALETINKFIDSLYKSRGVIVNNPKTWENTNDLNPFTVFEEFKPVLISSSENSSIYSTMYRNLSLYFEKGGLMASSFSEEILTKDLYDKKAVSFAFGILKESKMSLEGMALFKVKYKYASYIKNKIILNNYSKRIRTLLIMEEAQIAAPEVMKEYIEDWTARRAQLCDSLMLGNSILELQRKGYLAAIIENTMAVFLNKLNKDARDVIISSYDSQNLSNVMEAMNQDMKYSNAFLLIDKMGITGNLNPIVRLEYDRTMKNTIFTPDESYLKEN